MPTKDRYDFTIPEVIRAELKAGTEPYDCPKVVSLAPLTANDELQSAKVGRTDAMKAQFDTCKRSIVELDGRAVSYADADVDIFWERAGGKVRALILQAVDEIGSATREQLDDFLKSRKVRLA